LPRGIVAHGWLLFDQEKMSKSVGNVVRPAGIQQVLGADALRYFLLREVSFGQDGNFSFAALVARYNSDLANGWGNLASRTLTMIGKYRAGVVPARRATGGARPPAGPIFEEFKKCFDDWQFSRALEAVWELITLTDRYLSGMKPWALAESSEAGASERLDDVLRDGYEVLRWSAVMLSSAMPESAAKLWAQLGLSGGPNLPFDKLDWDEIRPGQKIGVVEGLFPRRDKEKTVEELRKLEEAPAAAVVAQPEKIGIEDFAKVDLRVGEVLTAERIKGADKLLKLTVDIGTEVRQIVAGIAAAYDPATLPGRKVVIVANLAPRKLRGVESNGMIVAAAVGEAGTPQLVGVPADTPNGARLR
ncbi:MAG TPA: methionine--tRNA ligase subunit beta, partial [Terriglobales bacterium]|nr:methionine--tRNA ligase subunit beta [Terriglobales bacterium]